MKRNIITWNDDNSLRIPDGEIWMSDSELVNLFGVFIPKLRAAIGNLYKEELVKAYEAEQTLKIRKNVYLTVYNFEVVLLLAYHLNSHHARAVRRELKERISRNHKPFQVILTAVKCQ